MRNLFKTIAVIYVFILSTSAFAEGLDRGQLSSFIQSQTKSSPEEANQLVNAIADQLNAKPGERLPIVGILYTHGLNGAFLMDSDTWYMNATIPDDKGNLVEIPELFETYFENGGFKVEIAYKWMFTIIPSGFDLHMLDGAIFGRGIGVTMDSFIGGEGAWMPGQNRAGSVFHFAIKLGLGLGLEFPRMTFHLRQIKNLK